MCVCVCVSLRTLFENVLYFMFLFQHFCDECGKTIEMRDFQDERIQSPLHKMRQCVGHATLFPKTVHKTDLSTMSF